MENNILIFTSKLTRGGGIDSWAILLGKELTKKGYNTYYLTIYDYGENNLTKNNYHSINENYNQNNIIKRLFHIFYRAYFLAELCKKNNIKTVISASNIPNLSAILSKLFGNKSKIITSIHNSFFLDSKSQKILSYSQKFAKLNIFVSKEAEYLYNKIFKLKNTQTIYNGIKNKYKIKEKVNSNSKKFITIGRLDRNKNYKFLLEIFEEYYKKNNNSELIILGDGELRNELENFKNILESKNNIKFLGIKENIYKYLNNSDYFLMISKLEGFPMVFIEAMSCGLPIITHDFKTGAKELIRGINSDNFEECKNIEITERGILVPFNNKEKYIEALEKLDTINFNRKKIKDNVESNFNIDNNIKQWIQIIEEKS